MSPETALIAISPKLYRDFSTWQIWHNFSPDHGNATIFSRIHVYKFQVDKVPLHFACQHGHVEIVKVLINGGAHLNSVDMVRAQFLRYLIGYKNGLF